MKDTTINRLGIWGCGIVGTSVARYCLRNGIEAGIYDRRPLSDHEQGWFQENSLRVWPSESLTEFLAYYDAIVPSPGIDLRLYHQYKHKWITEIDLFCAAWHSPLIAITGSVGKTSITHILTHLIEKSGKTVAAGGNIGIGMLDLLSKNKADIAILELSSFQLEHAHACTPTIAIITNIFPNHLDRHGSFEEYCRAKSAIFRTQHQNQSAIMPYELALQIYIPARCASQLFVYALKRPDFATLDPAYAGIIYFDHDNIVLETSAGRTTLALKSALSTLTFQENWLIICLVLHLCKLKVAHTIAHAHNINLPAHRVEYLATVGGLRFYNDSKSTTPRSTVAATRLFPDQQVHLFVGGLSKGIDRQPLFAQLEKNLVRVYCFGAEAIQLAQWCTGYGIASSAFDTLEAAFQACVQQATPPAVILFSPGGSSYDLFTHYEARGNCFKQLVTLFAQNTVSHLSADTLTHSSSVS